ncbi:MAG: DUF1302 domain-containing protein [Desulfuromonadales bacterium]|nr:DUF1302 domain-containing protein [Desulfuromonadales bacterium]
MSKSTIRGRWFHGGLTLALLLWAAAPAAAFQFTLGDVQGSLDTTVSYGLNYRTAEQDRAIVGTANNRYLKGARAYSVNGDDGNLNYKDDEYFSKVFKITSDLELKYSDFGLFVRGTAFHDFVNASGDLERTELDGDALDLVGENAELLDAFIWWDFELGGMPGTVRVGDQVLSWGESTFIQNGINTINPVDVSKLRIPGSELKEALKPVGMVSASLAANEYVSVEGFYQYDWEKTEIDPVGSYWSTNDFAGVGGNKVMLGWGDASEFGRSFAAVPAPLRTVLGVNSFEPDFLGVPRMKDETPSDNGQYGIALHALVPSLNDTEFGFYYINYHSRLPIISARTGSATGVAAAAGTLTRAATTVAIPSPPAPAPVTVLQAVGASNVGAIALDKYAKTARYYLEYPEDIQLMGASFSTQLVSTGTALQGEVSYRKDVPVQIDDIELLLAALTPAAFINPAYRNNQIGIFGPDTLIKGYEELDITQVQVTATQVFGPTFGADQFTLVGEVGITHVLDMPSKRLESPGTYVSGNPAQSALNGAHPGKPAEDSSAFADATSWGYRAVAKLDFNNAIGAVSLSPRVAWAHDVHGNSPNPGGNFLEHRKAVTVGVEANYQNAWSADLSYTDFFGAGRYNLINDRDFISFNVKYSF